MGINSEEGLSKTRRKKTSSDTGPLIVEKRGVDDYLSGRLHVGFLKVF
jgi:hypothetical protein